MRSSNCRRTGGQEGEPIGGGGAPLPPCNIVGYTDFNCLGWSPGCTSGTFKVTVTKTSGTSTFRKVDPLTRSERGECAGNAQCVTPESDDITSSGC